MLWIFFFFLNVCVTDFVILICKFHFLRIFFPMFTTHVYAEEIRVYSCVCFFSCILFDLNQLLWSRNSLYFHFRIFVWFFFCCCWILYISNQINKQTNRQNQSYTHTHAFILASRESSSDWSENEWIGNVQTKRRRIKTRWLG